MTSQRRRTDAPPAQGSRPGGAIVIHGDSDVIVSWCVVRLRLIVVDGIKTDPGRVGPAPRRVGFNVNRDGFDVV